MMEEFTDTTQGTTQVVFSSNLVFNNLLFGSANGLWSAIESQQLVVLLPLLDISIPPNAGIFYQALMQVCAFDPFPAEDFLHETLRVQPTAAYGMNFEMIGYESMWFIINIGSLAFLILSLPFLYLVVPVMSPCAKIKNFKTFRNWLRRNLFYSAPIRLARESYLILLIPALINLF